MRAKFALATVLLPASTATFASQFPRDLGDLVLCAFLAVVAIGSYVVGAWLAGKVCERVFKCDAGTGKGVAMAFVFGTAIAVIAINLLGEILH